MSALWYFEVATFSGGWQPQTAPARPAVATVNGVDRLKRGEGTGARIRAVQSVPDEIRHLGLAQLFNRLSPDRQPRAINHEGNL